MTAAPSGFAPVAAAQSAAGTVASALGKATQASTGGGSGLDGLFATLLALLDGAGATTGTSTQSSATAPLPGGDGSITSATIATSLATARQGSGSLLKDLGDALAAVKQTADAGSSISPALGKKLSDGIDALAGLLNIQLPQAGATPPAADAGTGLAATGAASAVDDALAALLGSASGLPQPGAADAATGDDATAPAQGTGDGGAQTSLAQVASRLHELSAALGTAAPDLAKKLEAVATGLDDPDAGALVERLGLQNDLDPLKRKLDAALASLTAKTGTGTGTTGTTVQQAQQVQPFATPTLAAPADTTGPTTGDPAAAAGPSDRHGLEAEVAKPQIAAAKPTDAKPDASGATSQASTQAAPAAAPAAAADMATTTSTPDTSPANAPPSLAVQQASGTTSVADARLAQAAYQPTPPAIPYPQVAFEIARQYAAGNSRFQIRLDPPELGRIDVKLDVDKHGGVTARMTVDRTETLDLMQRDRGTLERALQQAGIDSSKTDLQFSLRQNPSGGNGGGQQQQPVFQAPASPLLTDTAPSPIPVSIYRASATAGGVNLFV